MNNYLPLNHSVNKTSFYHVGIFICLVLFTQNVHSQILKKNLDFSEPKDTTYANGTMWHPVNLPGWVANLTEKTKNSYFGNASNQAGVKNSSGGPGTFGYLGRGALETAPSNRGTVEGGTKYTITFQLRNFTSSLGGKVDILWYDSNGRLVGSNSSGPLLVDNGRNGYTDPMLSFGFDAEAPVDAISAGVRWSTEGDMIGTNFQISVSVH